MNLLICKTEGNDFVLSNGVRPKFTVIGQQEAVSPESGQLPARAFENKTERGRFAQDPNRKLPNGY